MIYEVEIDGQVHEVQVKEAEEGGWILSVDGGPAERIQGAQVGPGEWTLDLDSRLRSIGCSISGSEAHVQVAGHAMQARVILPREKALAAGSAVEEGEVSSPMPGIVVRVEVSAGDSVAAGDVLLVVEAMKMENEYRSPIDGVVDGVHVQPGEAIKANTLLVQVVPA